ncbi:hypothetical protein T11_2183 [Trichinella zimbabwensis]|uniref:Uncharacterized protein n=1 Tax=Trichinella zimbabwensis TaxID=268475 RepID=A0A0V1H2Q1_9BILA|nr:hypothetical protein T11_2183 [Trichinella zimbabwensis]
MSQAVSKANTHRFQKMKLTVVKLSYHTGVARLTCTVACKNRQLPKTAVAAERKSNIHRRNIPVRRQYDGASTELNLGFGYVNWVSGLTDKALERCQDPKQLYEPEEEIGKRSSSSALLNR